MKQKNTYLYKSKNIGEYTFFIDDYSFRPTFTSNMIINVVLKNLNMSGKLLDLGCGCGIVGIIIGKCSSEALDLYASDISKSVEETVTKNANYHSLNIKVKKSNIFEEWGNIKFDYIINDISGVSSLIANSSPWFNNISCESGEGGDLLVNKVIEESQTYLTNKGKLFFPVISLSDKDSIISTAKKVFNNLIILDKQDWPMPNEMLKHLDLLRDLKGRGKVFFEEKFGILIGSTEIYMAYN